MKVKLPRTKLAGQTAADTLDKLGERLKFSFIPPTSREVAVSLSDIEAILPADGNSKGDGIWISSDDDSDTEDEGDAEGQDLDDLQSCATSTASITDHFDSRCTKHSPSELEAAIGVNTMLPVSSALGEEDPDWTQASHMGPLADPGPRQIAPYQRNRTSARVATAFIEANFDVSPPSPGSQPHPSVSDKQQLATGATSEPDIVIVDTLSDKRSSDGAQSSPTSLSHVYSHIAVALGDVTYTPLHDSKECASTLRDGCYFYNPDSTPAKACHPNHNTSKTSITV